MNKKTFTPKTWKQVLIQRGTSKDITDISLQELKKMDAKEVLDRFSMVIYSDNDIKQINKGLNLIREILKKNTEKLNGHEK